MEKETDNVIKTRTHRVGAFTSGFCMIGFGVLLFAMTFLVMILAGADVCLEFAREYWSI